MGLNLLWMSLYILGPLLLLTLLGVLFTQSGRRRRRRGKAAPSRKAVTGLLAGAMGLFWLLSMGTMTLVTANQLRERLTRRSLEFADWAERYSGLGAYYGQPEHGMIGRQYEDPEGFRRRLLEGAASYLSDFRLPQVDLPSGTQTPLPEDGRPFETAVFFADGYGRPLFEGNILFFPYLTAAQWAGDVSALTLAGGDFSYGWIQLPPAGEVDPYEPLRELRRSEGSLRAAVRVLRLTVRQEEGQLHPLSMAYVTRSEEETASMRRYQDTGPYKDDFIVDELDREGYLRWEPLFGEGGEEGTVTLYALDPELYLDDTSPITLQYASGETVRYGSLTALLREADAIGMQRSLLTVLTAETRYYRDPRDPSEKTVDLIMRTAVVSHPLKSAVKHLWPVYLAAALLCLTLVEILRQLLYRRLLLPLGEVLDGMAGEWYRLPPEDDAPLWREAEQLREQYRAEQDHRRQEAGELRRLEKAVEYAKAAEEERRLLTSNLAHELKTPLAVVHSYAEGLKEHIAEEKREQYLDTILSEAERMDALVMQMLDLSRLEAGKVKLSRDGFDLRALAAESVEKLRPLAEERGIAVALEPGEACEVTADEGRVAQAAENLLVNALRYAPAGSRVRLGVEKEGRQAVFRVENPVEKPFSPEEREKVWEPFYRRDKARSGSGTGLGLSIVRQIIELHGGTCILRNTASGVEFGFTLPL